MARRHSFNVPGIILCVAMMLTTALDRSANAQSFTGYITAYADERGESCALHDTSPGSFNVYILHEDIDVDAIGAEFRLAQSGGYTASYVGETVHPSFYFAGDTQSGIILAYSGCFNQDLLLVTVTYNGLGTSSPCSHLDVVAHPDFEWLGAIIVQSCTFELDPTPTRGPLYVNPDASCAPWCVVATEQTTWGKLKAMYRD